MVQELVARRISAGGRGWCRDRIPRGFAACGGGVCMCGRDERMAVQWSGARARTARACRRRRHRNARARRRSVQTTGVRAHTRTSRRVVVIGRFGRRYQSSCTYVGYRSCVVAHRRGRRRCRRTTVTAVTVAVVAIAVVVFGKSS